MTKKSWGGPRDGAGRAILDESEKKKGANIYINDKVKEEILAYGDGKSFSDKAVDLIMSELRNRKERV
jgi:hypothetical protein